jgi:hypothetical protein
MKTAGIIGLSQEELGCVQTLLGFLRHADPVVAEMARQALAYLAVMESVSKCRTLSQASASQ